MKRIILIMLGLAFIGLESMAQPGNGRGKGNAYGHNKNKGRKEVAHRGDRKNRNYDRGRGGKYTETVVYHRSRPTVTYRRPTVHVRVAPRAPRVRYVRHYTAAPVRSYVYVDRRYNRRVNSRVLIPEEVDQIAYEMDVANYDRARLDIAKSMLRQDMLYAEDVAFLMSHLHFESNRLELAKFAWRRTVDKRNYELAFNQLEYRSSQRELDSYISRF